MSGEFNGFVLLGILWFLLSLMTRGRRKKSGDASHETRVRSRETRVSEPRTVRLDPTQREGLRLETVLRDLRTALEQAAQPPGLPSGPVASRRSEEGAGSLEEEPEVQSLEGEIGRPVDLDEEAEAIEARRIQAVEARYAGRALEKPAKPAGAPQPAPADHTAVRSPAPALTPSQLRNAIVWREILGPPMSEQ
jgi:hypothetical protein